jgi:glyoxylase-like metal-dependent hydrolase (beta-lactamase superfamily II)
MPLEDDFSDIVKKARIGQGLAVEAVAKSTGLSVDHIKLLERGGRAPTKGEACAVADALGLKAEALTRIAVDGWVPPSLPARMDGLETIVGDIGGYAVKGYVLYDKEAGEGLIIDTGYHPQAMLDFFDENKLRLTAICLTHGHSDHAGGMDRILERWPVPVFIGTEDEGLLQWSPPKERLMKVSPDEEGRTISVGRLTVRMMMTPGHTPGGICYRVEDGSTPWCFVGDTLFAGSIGRANPSTLYSRHLESVRRRVLTLPASTVLFPGHGPATNVCEEVTHNPFGRAS